MTAETGSTMPFGVKPAGEHRLLQLREAPFRERSIGLGLAQQVGKALSLVRASLLPLDLE